MPRHAFAETTADFATPAGYNDNDYQKLVVFMETVNSSGVKNGEAINPGVYNPEDPATWLYSVEYPWGTTSYGVYWEEIDGEMRFVALDNGFSCMPMCSGQMNSGEKMMFKSTLSMVEYMACRGFPAARSSAFDPKNRCVSGLPSRMTIMYSRA